MRTKDKQNIKEAKKIVQIEVELPREYKYIARQPYGSLIAFKEKPCIVKDKVYEIEFWDVQEGEIELTNQAAESKGDEWKKTLRKI